MKVSFLKTNNSITLHYDGKTKLVANGDANFEKVYAALKEGRQDEIPGIVEPELYFRSQGLDMEDGLLKVDGEAMPPELNARIMEYKSDGLPFDSLINFWNNLKLNPSFNSRQQLFKFLDNKGHAITEDGCFTGYRGVTEDFKDKHTRAWNNSPGSICEMDRQLVDDNPNNTCSHGLHVGGYEYAKDFGPKLVMVKVNPKDVVAVPADYNGQKMRVCRFEVLSEATGIEARTVVGADGGEYEYEDDEYLDDEFSQEDFEQADEDFEALEAAETERIEKEHRARYANNHAKRGPDGKFIAKKSVKKQTKNPRRIK